MKTLFAVCFISLILFSCDRGPFAEHDVKLEKVSDNCAEKQSYFRLNSNFGGERYEFEKCLPADFDKKNITSERKGDTVVVSFTNAAAGNVVYHVTLDIDSYPRYSFITIDDETYTVVPSEK
jgi:hypothetical protein